MTSLHRIGFALALVLSASAQVAAQPAASTPTPVVEDLNGAKVRIDMPPTWNGGLVIYCHGYTPDPTTYDRSPANETIALFLKRGYAVAQSGYSGTGWAIAEAVRDIEQLRAYFTKRFGAPKETYVTGHSLGGFLTLVLMESSPETYDGGLAMCAPLAPASWFMARRVFDARVVFDYYFPNLLPSPVDPRAGSAADAAAQRAIATAVAANPERAAAFRQFAGLHANEEIPNVAMFFTVILAELHTRAGGNAFDNRFTRYQGSPDDAALNAGVARYAAVPAAAAYLQRYYTPSGRLARPMLALTTTYDPLIPAWVTNYYATLIDAATAGSRFAQLYVERGGHCAITAPEIDRAFAQLVDWRHAGIAPPGGMLTPPSTPTTSSRP